MAAVGAMLCYLWLAWYHWRRWCIAVDAHRHAVVMQAVATDEMMDMETDRDEWKRRAIEAEATLEAMA